jgi:iron complex transport system ATP-binding protein
MLEAINLEYKVGQRSLVKGINIGIAPGEFRTLIGPNGAGKTTLLRMIGGELKPTRGAVKIDGIPVDSWNAADLARVRAFLAQHNDGNFPFTVREITMMGRIPHLRGMRESIHDHEVVMEALGKVDMAEMADRTYTTLSGGEAARVNLARILAQEPRLLLLDEPTNHLDMRHQYEILSLVRKLANEGCTVISVLHDLNLASLYADKIVLMYGGECVAQGNPDDVLTAERIEETYGLQCKVWRHPTGCPWIVPHIDGRVPMPPSHSNIFSEELVTAGE